MDGSGARRGWDGTHTGDKVLVTVSNSMLKSMLGNI